MFLIGMVIKVDICEIKDFPELKEVSKKFFSKEKHDEILNTKNQSIEDFAKNWSELEAKIKYYNHFLEEYSIERDELLFKNKLNLKQIRFENNYISIVS